MSDIDDDVDGWSGSFDRSQQELCAMRFLGGLCAQSAPASPEVLATLQLLSPWMLPLLSNAFDPDFRTCVTGRGRVMHGARTTSAPPPPPAERPWVATRASSSPCPCPTPCSP